MLCLFSLVGCDNGQEQPNNEPKKSLKLFTESSMSFDAKGGVDCKILFELQGVDENALPEVVCDAD